MSKSNSKHNVISAVLSIYAIAVYVALFTPIVTMMVYSFNSGRLLLVWQEFSLEPYRRLFSNAQMLNSVKTSLKVMAIVAVLATVMGSLAGLHLARYGGWPSRIFVGLISIVLVTPEIVNAVALLPWFVFLGVDASLGVFDNGLLRLAFGHAIFPTSVVAFIVRARMTGVNSSLENAAADLYATPWRSFLQITLLMMMPAIVAGALLSATMSMDNVIISSFVSVQGSSPWPVYVFGSLRSGMRPEIAALSTIMCCGVIASLVVAALFLKRDSRSVGPVVTGRPHGA